uniref:BTB domain-containing protein n=3 Tax=Panagrolaimus sp. PS1159 TaxID=55785 RepID=A0AC35GJL4_9BILA
MESLKYINQFHPQIVAAFKSQDPELFDIVFEIEGKKLYADKLILSLNSSTFKSMLSDRWISKNDAIKIETYKFDDFKELLTFIYSGKCKITNENISEFYQIQYLKELCEKYLSKMELNKSNIIQLLEISNKYSIIQIKKPIQNFIFQNFKTIFKTDGFLNAEKSIVTEINALGESFAIKYEEMFQAAYEWSENEAIKKQDGLSDENVNMNDAIKVEMRKFLAYTKFNQMEYSFFTEYVVKITNEQGQSVYDILPKEISEVCEIKSFHDQWSVFPVVWNTNCEKPSTHSPLKKRIGAKCYLVIYFYGYIGIFANPTDDCYLLAEMFSESDFKFTGDCKIEIV